MIYKILPDVEVRWRDVWIGAAVTSLLFSIGRTLIGLYLGNSSISSTYGAAASLVVILIWVYYSAQLLFFGAEFTQVYAHHFGKQIVPEKGAVPEEAAGTQPAAAGSSQPTQPAPAAGRPAGMAMAVPVTGANQPGTIRLPLHKQYPRTVEPVLPPMPAPVKIFTRVVGALAVAVGLSGLLWSRSRAVQVNRPALEAAEQLTKEGQRLREEAARFRGAGSRMEHVAGRIRKTGKGLGSRGEKLVSSGEKLKKKAQHKKWF
jgi:hypothetical protein